MTQHVIGKFGVITRRRDVLGGYEREDEAKYSPPSQEEMAMPTKTAARQSAPKSVRPIPPFLHWRNGNKHEKVPTREGLAKIAELANEDGILRRIGCTTALRSAYRVPQNSTGGILKALRGADLLRPLRANLAGKIVDCLAITDRGRELLASSGATAQEDTRPKRGRPRKVTLPVAEQTAPSPTPTVHRSEGEDLEKIRLLAEEYQAAMERVQDPFLKEAWELYRRMQEFLTKASTDKEE